MPAEIKPTVHFKEYVEAPGSRDQVRRIVASDKLTLSMDSIGVRVRTGDYDDTYPWAVIAKAANVPRAK